MFKDFDLWNSVKKKLDVHTAPAFQEREIWWRSIGLNVGHEENGKNEFFNRPILVVRKFNQHIFLGIPLTSKTKDNKFYYQIHFKGKNQSAMLSQIRTIDSRRLTHRMGKITRDQLEDVRRRIREVV
jgi:mRNA interferase MazF